MSWWNFQKKDKKPGLKTKFKAGEQLPWKGIYFEVAGVGFDEIILKPVGLTWQKTKEIEKAKRR